jgi:hypothetical protein
VLTIVHAVETCAGCPMQWDAWTDTGQYLYLRYRFGKGTVDDYPDNNVDAWTRIPEGSVVRFRDEDCWAGEITLDEFCDRAGIRLALGRRAES